MRRYIWNLAVAFDQLINTFLAGDPDETLSSRAGKNLHRPHWRTLARVLNWISPGHINRSIEWDEGEPR